MGLGCSEVEEHHVCHCAFQELAGKRICCTSSAWPCQPAAQPHGQQITNKTIGDNVEQRLGKETCLFLCSLGNPGLPGPRRAWACLHLQVLLTVGKSLSQGIGRKERGLPVTDHTGESRWSQCYFSLDKCPEELCNILGSTNSKTHVTKDLLFLPLYFSPMYIFKTMESICVWFIYT